MIGNHAAEGAKGEQRCRHQPALKSAGHGERLLLRHARWLLKLFLCCLFALYLQWLDGGQRVGIGRAGIAARELLLLWWYPRNGMGIFIRVGCHDISYLVTTQCVVAQLIDDFAKVIG